MYTIHYATCSTKFHKNSILKSPSLLDLKIILFRLTTTTKNRLKNRLQNWHRKYDSFLNEMTINHISGEVTYTHYKLRAAYVSFYVLILTTLYLQKI